MEGPRQVRVADDGSRVVFLHGSGLWVYDVDLATARQVADAEGSTTYAIDPAARSAVLATGGPLRRVDLDSGEATALPSAGPPSDPRLDPTGTWIGYLTGGRLYATGGTDDVLLAGEPDPARDGHPHVAWGVPEPAGRHFGRRRGWWWGPQRQRSGSQASPQQFRSGSQASPDGRTVLATRVDRSHTPAAVSLHLLELDGGWVDVHWDRETYPYLASVCWDGHGDPLVAVLRRPPQHGLVLAIDSRTGETQVHAELADPRWVAPVPGTPCHLADGRVLVGGELAHDGYDARCLFADGSLLTPPSLYVRRVVGRLPGSAGILIEGSTGEPSEQHLFQVDTSAGSAAIDARRLTTLPGWHRAAVGGATLVVGSETLEQPGRRWTVHRDGRLVGHLAPPAPARSLAPQPQLARVTDRRLPAGVLYPRTHFSGRRLPVLVAVGAWSGAGGGTRGGSGDAELGEGLDQGVRAVRADWAARQEWADLGCVVVVVDHRGTPGVAPSYEKVVYRRLADLALADLLDALAALTGKHPDLDLQRVAVRGRGVGGWLAVLAVLAHPDRFRCAVAESPVVDWADHEPVVAERYLGLSQERAGEMERAGEVGGGGAEVYSHHNLLDAASRTDQRRPMLLVPDPAAPGPTDRLGARLGATVLPPTASPDQVRAASYAFLRRQLFES